MRVSANDGPLGEKVYPCSEPEAVVCRAPWQMNRSIPKISLRLAGSRWPNANARIWRHLGCRNVGQPRRASFGSKRPEVQYTVTRADHTTGPHH
jgi:hypothetical protein